MFLWRSLLSCFHITGYKINWMSLFFQPFDCSSVFWRSPFDWNLLILFVPCMWCVIFLSLSCSLQAFLLWLPVDWLWCFEFFLFEICGGSWMCYLISRNVSFFFFFYYFKYFFLPLYPFFLQGPSLHMHRHLILYQESDILFILVNNFLFLQMGYFLLTYFQHWFWCWAPPSFSFQLLNFQLYRFFFNSF